MKYSLIGIFGTLPVRPEVFSTLDSKLKWLGVAAEGGNWCTNCGTLNPQTPRSHHPECFSYMDADDFPEYKNPLGTCPECESDDGLKLDSSRELQVSTITCCDCGYEYSGNMPEETLKERFLTLRLGGKLPPNPGRRAG